MSVVDSGKEGAQPDVLRYTIAAQTASSHRWRWVLIVAVALAIVGVWYFVPALRFHKEEKTVGRFLDALMAGHIDEAYRIWHAQPSYSYDDFLQDWGPSGYYGPIKSYDIQTAQEPPRRVSGPASGVVVVVELSPYRPFPSSSDADKNRYTKEVRIWVERSDQSLSFPP